jgi:cell division protein FtsW (lipid II flippase)
MKWKAFIKRHKTGKVRASVLELSLFVLMGIFLILFEIYYGKAAVGRITDVGHLYIHENPFMFWIAILLQLVLVYVLVKATIKQYERSKRVLEEDS